MSNRFFVGHPTPAAQDHHGVRRRRRSISRAAAVATLPLASAAMLAACGSGESSSEDGFRASIDAPSTMMAGDSASVRGQIMIKGDIPKSMQWSVAPVSNTGTASPTIVNADCAQKSTSPALLENGWARGVCVATLALPYDMTSGRWRLTLSGANVTLSASHSVDFDVAPADRSLAILNPRIITTTALAPVTVPAALELDPLRHTYSDLRYEWKFNDASQATPPILGSDTQSALFQPPEAGSYILDLKVTGRVDGRPVEARKSIMVIADAPDTDSIEVAPTQFASPGQSVTLAGKVINELPNHRYDWLWKQTDGPVSVSIVNSNAPTTAFFAPIASGVYSFRADVTRTSFTSGVKTTKSAQTQVFVSNAMVAIDVKISPEAPVAGRPVTMQANVANLDAKALSAKNWKWVQISGPTATLNTNGALASFAAPASGTYAFEVSVDIEDARGSTFKLKQLVSVSVGASNN